MARAVSLGVTVRPRLGFQQPQFGARALAGGIAAHSCGSGNDTMAGNDQWRSIRRHGVADGAGGPRRTGPAG